MRLDRIAALLFAAAPMQAFAQAAPLGGPPFITVEGQAGAEIAPDMARLSVGVVAERPTAAAATAEVARAAQAMTDQVKADGLDDKDVTTGSIALAPIYPEELTSSGQSRPPRGFRASTDFVLTVRPPEKVGLVASHLVDKGANAIEGIVFASSQQDRRLDDLRADAMREARRKADIYVVALGLRLGRVLEISPQAEGGAPPQTFARSASILAAPTPKIPVEPGTLALRAGVSVRWEILQ